MKEIFTIRGWVLAVVEREHANPHGFMDIGFPTAFYDAETGEIWGKRTIVGVSNVRWKYMERDPKTMDLTYPREWAPYGEPSDQIPDGVLAAMVLTDFGTVKSGINGGENDHLEDQNANVEESYFAE